jgi:hypothetical protein
MKKHLEINYTDDRGTIRDIFISNPKDHCSIITFAANAIRGNQFHKESTQYTYVIDGELIMATCVVNELGEPVGNVELVSLLPGDIATHLPYDAHAFRAISGSTILAFADGVRGGHEYEKDVFRLKNPIID